MRAQALPPPAAPRKLALLVIVALHVLLVAAWLSARWVVALPAERLGQMVWIALPTEPVRTPPAAQPEPRPVAAADKPRAPNAAARPEPRPRAAQAPQAITLPPAALAADPTAVAEAAPPEPAASRPLPRLLDTEATRRAIRAAGSQPLLAERAAAATGIAIVSKSERFAEDAAQAAKGDCIKGEYFGAGLGLLSLPALAIAAATGNCAK